VTTPTHDQWIRKSSLVLVSNSTSNAGTQEGISIPPDLRFTFFVTQADAQTYNGVRIRIYNLSDKTVAKILGATGVEYTRVILQAGYEHGNYGVIFDGTIKQFGHGRESNVTSYLDIFASNGDRLNFATVNTTVAAPVAWDGQVQAISDVVTPYGYNVKGHDEARSTGGVLPRGKVMYGMPASFLRDLGQTRLTTWSIQGNTLVEIPLRGYLAGDVVVLNSQTGLLGTPQATQNGITAMCLLNPKIVIGQRVKLNNREINQTIVKNRAAFDPNPGALVTYASEAADGIYRVCVHEVEGDTRGNPWYSHLVLLALDPSAAPDVAAPLS
jgi:hypothetical protein